MSRERHGAALRLVHWITAALVLSLLGLGLAMVDSFATWRSTGIRLHKIGGVLVLLLTAVRIVARLEQRTQPAAPAGLDHRQQLAMSVVHAALYVLLVLVPVSGWLMQNAAGTPVYLPGGYMLPRLLAEDLVMFGVLREAHGTLTFVLLLAILAHVGGALHDGLVSRRGLLQRMWR